MVLRECFCILKNSLFYKGQHNIEAPTPEDLTLVIDKLKNQL